MRAGMYVGVRKLAVREVPAPEPGPGEVQIAVEAAGICGSDLHGYRNASPERLAQLMQGPARGHELAGRVVALGEGVTSVRVGDRVGIEPLCGCGACPWCEAGDYHLCPRLEHIGGARSGGFAELTVAPADKVFPLPDHVSTEEAALLDCLAVAVHALRRVPVHFEHRVLVVGAATIGLSTLQCARLMSPRWLGVVGRYPEHLALAREFGADAVYDVDDPGWAARMTEETGGGADVVFETVGGGPGPLQTAVAGLAPGGTIGVVGGFPSIEVPMRTLMRKEATLAFCWSYCRWGRTPEYRIALDLLARGRLRAKEMITHRLPLDAIDEAFRLAADKKSSRAIKVLILPQARAAGGRPA
ncbi:MAG TPA: alcohol dehydrogenase catalytic domain-containing protein [Limnochordia bacterium]